MMDTNELIERAESEADDLRVRERFSRHAMELTADVIDDLIAALRAEKEARERAEAALADTAQREDKAVLAEKMRMMAWCSKRAAISRVAWERASRKALAGDMAELRNRIAMIDDGPMSIVLSASDASGPSANNAEAMVAAAYRDAAEWIESVPETLPNRQEYASIIRKRTPADAQAALDRMLKQAADEALEKVTDPDFLAQVIRTADGSNTMGAGELGEALSAAIRAMKGGAK